MSETHIGPDDQIARCLIYPKFFSGNIHVSELLWEFGKTGDDGASHNSAVLRSLCPLDDDVHRIGCKISRIQNERRGATVAQSEKMFYCGYRQANVSDLVLVGDQYFITLSCKVEFGESSHVDVALFVSAPTRNARAVRRTDAGLALAEAFGLPAAHICPDDAENQMHPINRFTESCLVSGLRDRWLSLTPCLPLDTSQDLTLL